MGSFEGLADGVDYIKGLKQRLDAIAVKVAAIPLEVRGRVNANATVAAGAGFSVARGGGTGDYRITFTKDFGVVPVATITMVDAVRLGLIPRIYAHATNSVFIAFETPAGTLTDVAFEFIAAPPT